MTSLMSAGGKQIEELDTKPESKLEDISSKLGNMVELLRDLREQLRIRKGFVKE